MKNTFLTTIICLSLGLLLMVGPMNAKISPLVNFQGYITDKTGMPVADGDYDVKFSIYDGDDETASELWNEIQQVTVKNGFYTASLGAVTAFKDPNRDTDESDALGFSQPYYLGIKVRQSGETSWDEIGFDGRYLPLSSVWSSFRSKTSAGRLIAIKDENSVISDAEDMLLVVGNTQITLSQALNAAGRMITIKKIDPKGTVVSIITKNGETINGNNHDPNDGANPYELTEKFQEINLISDGRNWISTGGQISLDTGTGTTIEPDSIQTSHLANQSVTNAKLADNSVTSQKLALEDLTIPHENLELKHAITDDNIAPDADIAYTKLNLDGAIITNDLADHSVTAKKLDLTSGDLSYSMINFTGLIINSDIADNASISHTKLDLTGLSTEELFGIGTIAYNNLELADSIKNSDISKNAEITYDKLNLNNSIQTTDLTNGAVTYPKLSLDNGAIPYAKLSLQQSITDVDIADNAQISYTKLNLHGQISSGDILNDAVTLNKIDRNAVDSIRILDESITAADLSNGCITPNKLYVSQSGTSGQVLATDGVGGLYWHTVSETGSIPDELPKLTVLGHSQLNTVSAQSAIITQAAMTNLTSKIASVLTATVNHADIQNLHVGQTKLINLASSSQSLTIPDVSGNFLISGHPMITAKEISEKAIESQHIDNGIIQDSHIASNAKIPYGKLMLDSAIQDKDIASQAITYEKLDLADKIVPYTVLNLTGAIQGSDLATGSLGYSSIDLTNSIQSKDIVDGTIQNHDIANQTIMPTKLSGILNNGNFKEALMSDGGGGFYWSEPSPFDVKISEINYKKMLGAGQIDTPSGIVVTENNYVILAERSSDRIRIFDNEGQMNTNSIGSGKLNAPQGMVLDSDNNLFVVDQLNDQIQIFAINLDSGTGELKQSIGTNDLAEPYGIALDKQGKIYVTDTAMNMVCVYTADGSFDYTFGGSGSSAGKFNTPYGITIDRSGHIFVLDSGNHRVQKFDANWQYITEFPSAQNRDLGTPYGIGLDDSGNVYVSDTTNSRIQIYDNNGYFIKTVLSTESQFNPKQLVVDRSGKIYVSDTDNNRVQVFHPEDPIYTIQSTTVSMGTVNPYSASALQIDSQKGGLLIPRMTFENRELIENPIQGLLVYQTDGHGGFYFFDGSQWVNFDSNIYNNVITEPKIANDAVTSEKVLDNSITGDDIQEQSLPVTKLTISGTRQNGHMLVADGTSLKWQAYDQLSHVLTVGDGGQYSTISNALASITDHSETNRYLIKIGPGTFIEQITLKQYVDIEGSGENQTIILFSGSNTHPSIDNSSATVVSAMNCEVRFLSIVSQSSGNNYALGVYNAEDASPTFKHVTIKAIGAQENYGIYHVDTTGNFTINNCNVSAMGGTQSTGIQTTGNILIHDSNITAANGIVQEDGTVEIDHGRITASIGSVQVNNGSIQLIGTRLEGAVNTGNQGEAKCAGVYGVLNNEVSFYTNTCPQ